MPPDADRVAECLREIEQLMIRSDGGSLTLPPTRRDRIQALLRELLATPELPRFALGLAALAERIAQSPGRALAADAIRALLDQPEVLARLDALAHAEGELAQSGTTITPEANAQMRAGVYQAILGGGLESRRRRSRVADGAGTAPRRLKVFLSHSSVDKPLARRLARDLGSADVEVWLDQWEIAVGDAFAQHIEQGLSGTDFVIVLLTCNSVASDWVTREWREKVGDEAATRRIAVVPVRAENCEMPDFLAQRSHADISGGSYVAGFRRLLDLLQHHHAAASIGFARAATADEARRRQAHLLEIERRILGLEERGDSLQHLLPVVTPIAVEVAHDLIRWVEPDAHGRSRAIDQLAPATRDALQRRYGFAFPGIRIRGNTSDMPSGTVLVYVDEVPELTFTLDPDAILVDAAPEALGAHGIAASAWRVPVTGHEIAAVAAADRDAVQAAGWTTRDAAEAIFAAVYQVICRMPAEFLDPDGVQRLVDALPPVDAERVLATVPACWSWVALTQVLQGLLEEDLSIGNLTTIVAALGRCDPAHRSLDDGIECARHALRAQIGARFAPQSRALQVLQLTPGVETLVVNALQPTAVGTFLSLAPAHTQALLAAVRGRMRALGAAGAGVVLLTRETGIRRFLRRMVKLEFPDLHALSLADLPERLAIEVVGTVELPAREGGVT